MENTCTAPGLFVGNYQCEPTTLVSSISCIIRAASEALICGRKNNMVNNVIAALSCALMLREQRRQAGGWGCAEDVPVTFKNISRRCFCFGRKHCLSLKHAGL